MRRWSTFLFGAVVGGLLIYTVLNYHIIRANDGLHLIPKVNAQLADTYVDITKFAPRDWLDHPSVFVALQNAHQDQIIGTVPGDALRNGLDRWLPPAEGNR